MEAPRSSDFVINPFTPKETPSTTETSAVFSISKYFSETLESANKSLKTTLEVLTNAFFVDLKKEINFKYTREGVDQKHAKDFSPNSAPQLQHKILNKMLDAVSSATIKSGQAQVSEFKKCLGRSKKFFDLDITILASLFITQKLNVSNLILSKVVSDIQSEFNNLKADESFLFPAGPYKHAVVFKITKDEDGQLLLRLYNTGDGGEFIENQDGSLSACMPQFRLDPKSGDLKGLFTSIIELCTKADPKYNQTVEKLIIQHGGKRTQNIFHNSQDRNNCAWKSLSTCFSDFVKGVTAIASQEILDKLPFDVQVELEKGPIDFKKLVKIVDYEALRTKAKQIGQAALSRLKTQDSLKGIKQEKTNVLTEQQKQFEGDKRLQELKEMSAIERVELKKDRKIRVQLAKFISQGEQLNLKDDLIIRKWILSDMPKDLLEFSKQKEYLNQCKKLYPDDHPILEELFSAVNLGLALEIIQWTCHMTHDDLSLVPERLRSLKLDKESFTNLANLLGETKTENMRQYFELRDLAEGIASKRLNSQYEIRPFDYLKGNSLMTTCKTVEERAMVRQNFNAMISQSMFDQLLERKLSSDELGQFFMDNPDINVDIHTVLSETIPYCEEYAKYKAFNEELKTILIIGFYRCISFAYPVPKVIQDLAMSSEQNQNELLQKLGIPQKDADKFREILKVVAKAKSMASSDDFNEDIVSKEYQNLNNKSCSLRYFRSMILQFMCEWLQKPYALQAFCDPHPDKALELYNSLLISQEPFAKKKEAIQILDAMDEIIVKSCRYTSSFSHIAPRFRHLEERSSYPASTMARILGTNSEIAQKILDRLPKDEAEKTAQFLSFIKAACEMAQKKMKGETISDDTLMETLVKQPLMEGCKTEEDKKSLLARFKVITNQFQFDLFLKEIEKGVEIKTYFKEHPKIEEEILTFLNTIDYSNSAAYNDAIQFKREYGM